MPNYDNLYTKAQRQIASGDKNGALASLSKCSKSKPYKLRCFSAMGNIYCQISDYAHAEPCFKKAVKLDPKNNMLWYYLAMCMIYTNRSHNEILTAFKTSLKLNSNFASAWYGAGIIYRDMGIYSKAKDYLLKSLDLDTNLFEARVSLAAIHRSEGNYETSLNEYIKCIAIQPNNADALAGKALALFYLGKVTTAAKEITAISTKFPSHPFVALSFCEICKQSKHALSALQYINNVINVPGLTPKQKSDLHYSAAKLCDKLGKYDQAFNHLRLANKFIGERYSEALFLSNLSQNKISSSQKLLRPSEEIIDNTITPIFILGMPRSGSSLVEQILSCHNEIYGGGELSYLERYVFESLESSNTKDISQLNNATLLNIRHKYLSKLTSLADGEKYITDKLPGNFERIGIINALFPNAKIINTNRNKLDVCISCFFQNFGGKHMYTCNLESMAHAYEYYEDIISFWREHSDINIYDTSYENLTTNTKDEVSKLLGYLEIPWSDACLEHHKSKRLTKTASFDQARQPIYTGSIDRWKNYKEHIPKLIEKFGLC